MGRNSGCVNPTRAQASTCPADASESIDTEEKKIIEEIRFLLALMQ